MVLRDIEINPGSEMLQVTDQKKNVELAELDERQREFLYSPGDYAVLFMMLESTG